MTAVWVRLRAELGGRWPSWAALAMLIGLAGSVVLASAAGARRTESAYPRFLESSRAADLLISPQGSGQTGYYEALAHRPEVQALGVVVGLVAVPVASDGRRDIDALVAAAGDAHYGADVERPKLLAGRLFHPDRQDEAVIDQAAARRLHLRIGSTVTLYLFPNSDPQLDPTRDPPSRRLSARVVGIIVTRDSVVPLTALDAQPLILLGPAVPAAVGSTYFAFDGAYVRLRQGASVTAFSDRAHALIEDFPETGGQLYTVDEADPVAKVERAIRPEWVTLAVFSLLTAATALLVVGQVASRQLVLATDDDAILRALGMTRAQLFALGIAKVGIAAACGAALAVVAATAASPLMPIGPAQVAEPHPGISLDVTVLSLGFIGIIVLMLARAAWPALRLASTRLPRAGSHPRRPSVAAGGVSWLGAWPTAAIGLRMATEPGRGRTAVPIRSTVAGTVIALAAVVAAYTFGANLVQLVSTPRLFGQTWDLALDASFNTMPTAQVSEQLHHQPGVSAWTFGNYGSVIADGRQVPAIGLDRGGGPLLLPTLLEGRAPSSGEIVLGTRTLDRLHERIGDVIEAQVNGTPARLRIVGRAIFPAFSQGSFAATDLGEGAALPGAALAAPAPDPPGDIYNFVLVHLAPGADRSRTAAALARSLCPHAEPTGCLITTQRPSEIVNYARVQNTPLILAAVLMVLAIATFVHLLATSTRRWRRDLAVVKALGFVRGQVLATVEWQGAALAVLALAAGVPLGVLAGRWAWAAFAGRLGVDTQPDVPLAVLLALPITLLVAGAAALGPGLAAMRTRPAAILRAD